jgi:DNA-binding NtrC family response regulator
VEVTSRVGEGADFRVYFPAQQSPATAAPPETPRESFVAGRGTILLVEDEELVRQMAGHILRRHGYRVLEADCGIAAFALWNANPQAIDLVLTDVIMPGGISGRDLANRIWRTKPRQKVLFTSGYSPSRAGKDTKSLEGLRFFPKPYGPDKLLHAVRECMTSPNGVEHE